MKQFYEEFIRINVILHVKNPLYLYCDIKSERNKFRLISNFDYYKVYSVLFEK